MPQSRIGLLEVQARIDGTDGQGAPGFTLAAMKRLDLNDIDYAAQLTLPALVQLCNKFQAAGGTAPTTSGGKVPLGDARTTLAHWNGRWDADQRGAVLIGEFWAIASGASPSPFSHRFELAHPVTTPFGLNTANTTVHNALGDAIAALNKGRAGGEPGHRIDDQAAGPVGWAGDLFCPHGPQPRDHPAWPGRWHGWGPYI